ncbi:MULTISPECIES: CapA family protein [unclassified Proteiniphilum]|jgi:poly-gamma-glutamate synthesis protein (capsule biosynthesis protein)|uniref:CapA family protein n=1 Tax=Proteiniphilum sp. UBA5310 TaxID=1947275 RepID=UPI00257BE510|nr:MULTISPECIES: CapA family protein [unclassified Proteiniphilum]
MRLLITGDLVVNKPYNPTEQIDQSLIDLFAQSNINIVNLEAPVTDSINKILKTGPNIKSHREATQDLFKVLKVDVATLANNHVFDYDKQGVVDTLNFCYSIGVKTVGAGINLNEASQTLYLDTEEGKIAIVNFAENEWASATETTAGAHPMDIIYNTRIIKEVKKKANYVIVIVHGGHEYYNLPSPRMQKQYRFYADQGADIVIGHHTHCISGNEVYKGVPIYYSLGNFLFTKNNINDDWYTGLILDVGISNNGIRPQLHPVRQQRESFKLSLLKGDVKGEVLARIENFNDIISDNQKLQAKWNEYIDKQSIVYLNYWSPLSFIKNRYISGLCRKLGINFLNKKGMALFLNLIRCEAHWDMNKEIIGKYLKK